MAVAGLSPRPAAPATRDCPGGAFVEHGDVVERSGKEWIGESVLVDVAAACDRGAELGEPVGRQQVARRIGGAGADGRQVDSPGHRVLAQDDERDPAEPARARRADQLVRNAVAVDVAGAGDRVTDQIAVCRPREQRSLRIAGVADVRQVDRRRAAAPQAENEHRNTGAAEPTPADGAPRSASGVPSPLTSPALANDSPVPLMPPIFNPRRAADRRARLGRLRPCVQRHSSRHRMGAPGTARRARR